MFVVVCVWVCVYIISSLKLAATELSFNTEEVVRACRKSKENTTLGPDNISGCVLWCYAEQLGEVFQLLFQQSMDSGTVSQL